jgi:hypothetical protein
MRLQKTSVVLLTIFSWSLGGRGVGMRCIYGRVVVVSMIVVGMCMHVCICVCMFMCLCMYVYVYMCVCIWVGGTR